MKKIVGRRKSKCLLKKKKRYKNGIKNKELDLFTTAKIRLKEDITSSYKYTGCELLLLKGNFVIQENVYKLTAYIQD